MSTQVTISPVELTTEWCLLPKYNIQLISTIGRKEPPSIKVTNARTFFVAVSIQSKAITMSVRVTYPSSEELMPQKAISQFFPMGS